MNKYCTD